MRFYQVMVAAIFWIVLGQFSGKPELPIEVAFLTATQKFEQFQAPTPSPTPGLSEADTLFQQGIELLTGGNFRDSLDKLQRAQEAYHQQGKVEQEADVLTAIGIVYLYMGNPDAALTAQQQALELARGVKSTRIERDALVNIGQIYIQQSRYEEAVEVLEQSLPLSQSLNDTRAEGAAQNSLGDAYAGQGRYNDALSAYQLALNSTQQLNQPADQVTVLTSMGTVYNQQGDYKRSLETLMQALTLARSLNAPVIEARVLSNLGAAYSGNGDFDNALRYYQEALGIVRNTEDRASEGFILRGIADTYATQGTYTQTNESLLMALTVARDSNDSSGEGATLNRLGDMYTNLGEYEEATTYYEQALAIARKIQDRAMEIVSLVSLGGIYTNQDQHQRALDVTQQALKIARDSKNRASEGRVLGNLGTVYYSQGLFAAALDTYGEALDILRSVGDRQAESATLVGNGAALERLGQYADALRSYDQALDLVRSAGARRIESKTLRNICSLYTQVRLYKKAEVACQQALPLAQQVGDQIEEALITAQIGSIYYNQGQLPESLVQYQRVLDLLINVDAPAQKSRVLTNIGSIYEDQSKYADALAVDTEALHIVETRGDRQAEGRIRAAIGHIYLSQKDYKNALTFYESARTIMREIGDVFGEERVLYNMGLISEDQRDFKEALAFYEESLALAEQVRASASLEELKTGLESGSITTYEHAIRILVQLNRRSEAFELSERARARTFLDQLGNTRLATEGSAGEKLQQQEHLLRAELATLRTNLIRERAKHSQQPDAEVVQTLSEQLRQRQTEYEDLLTRLKLSNPEYASLVSVSSLTLTDTQKLIDERTTLLSYFTTPDEILIFVITRNGFRAVEVTASTAKLEELISQQSAGLSQPTQDSSRALYDLLISPIEKYLSTDVVGIIPHGPLHYVPFAALYDGKEYLLNKYVIFHLPSASSYYYIKMKGNKAEQTLLAVGQGQIEGLPTLHYVTDEAEHIADLYGSKALTGTSATEGLLVSRSKDYNIIHIAAHGQLSPDSPIFSSLALAPDTDHDGFLEVHEIYGMDLRNCGLVVLSACQTNLGPASRGDEIVALNRAFLYAGAPTVIASLWTVDDEATSNLMLSFYSHLRSGKSKAEALREAQKETRARFASPYYWAGFVLNGDPGFEPTDGIPTQYLWYAAIGLVLLVVLGLVIYLWRTRTRRKVVA
jgi:CHAT domain-containing protein/Flp pilus assembly protein TadD